MSKIDQSQSDWANYWTGREAGRSNEVFAGEGVENNQELSTFWTETFAETQTGAVLDLACGAGSAIKYAVGSGADRLIGLDISAEAIQATRRIIPELEGVVASADALPFADRSISHAFSQFGFEYANRDRAAAEIARVIGDAGRFTAIAHMKAGAIAQECEGHLSKATAIHTSGYLPTVRALFDAVFAYDKAPGPELKRAVDEAGQGFTRAQDTLLPHINSGGLARHLHTGTSQLFERRKAYLLDDIFGWLDQMTFEIEAYSGRMRGMLSAAIDEEEAAHIVKTIAPDRSHAIKPLLLSGKPAAWVLSAGK